MELLLNFSLNLCGHYRNPGFLGALFAEQFIYFAFYAGILN